MLDDRVDAVSSDSYGNLTAEIVNYADGAVTSGDDLAPNASTGARTDLTTSHTYDTAGNRISSADPRRAILGATGSPAADDYVTRWTYDGLNQKLTERTPTTPGVAIAQKTDTSDYDELGAVRSSTDFGGLVTATEYDRAGRATETFEDTDGSGPLAAALAAQTTYDADGRVLTAKDREQAKAGSTRGQTSSSYDALGRLVLVTAADGTSEAADTATDYDALDRRKQYSVGGQDTTYSYDLGGRVTATDDGFTCTTEGFDYRDLATTTTYGKDGHGCAGTGQYIVTHTIDGLGRLTRDERGDGTRTTDAVVDAVGNRRASSPRTFDKDGNLVTTTTTFSINLLGQTTSELNADGSTAKTTFDAAGNPADHCTWNPGTTVGICLAAGTTPWTSPPSSATSSGYDALNQRISLSDAQAETTTVFSPVDNYQPAGVYVPLANGREHQTLYTYDERHRLTTITFQACTISGGHDCQAGTVVPTGSDAYEYDENDNRTRVIEDSGAGATDWRYCYDARNQLTIAVRDLDCPANADEVYTYDDAGNRIGAQVGGISGTVSYSSEGQLAGKDGASYTYDDAGRLSSDGSWVYTYDADGRLVEICDIACTGQSSRWHFTYDADGKRTQTWTFAGGVNETRDFLYAGDRLIAESLAGTVVRQYVTDEAGTVVKVIVPRDSRMPASTWSTGTGTATPSTSCVSMPMERLRSRTPTATGPGERRRPLRTTESETLDSGSSMWDEMASRQTPLACTLWVAATTTPK